MRRKKLNMSPFLFLMVSMGKCISFKVIFCLLMLKWIRQKEYLRNLLSVHLDMNLQKVVGNRRKGKFRQVIMLVK